MKKLLLGFLTIFAISSAFSQTVNFTQQATYYYANHVDNGGTFLNGAGTVDMNTTANGNSDAVGWRKLKTSGDNTGSNRSMNIGDKFTITVNAIRAKGEIGFALLASPSSTSTYADRTNNYALSVNLDGPDSLGGTNYGKWYVRGANGDTSRFNFGGATSSGNSNYASYKIECTMSATDRMNVTITNLNATVSSTINDVHLNTSNPITDYSIYLSDANDGSGVAKVIHWQSPTSMASTGVVSLGASNKSFNITSSINNGSSPTTNAGVTNLFKKLGSGDVTLSAAATYSGTTSVLGGTLSFGVPGALPFGTPGTVGTIILNGGNLSTNGFSQGSRSFPTGPLQKDVKATLALGAGNHSFFFDNSNPDFGNRAWGDSLIITGWIGNPGSGAAANSGKVYFGSTNRGINADQLALIKFVGYGDGAQIVDDGQISPLYAAAPTSLASNGIYSNTLLNQATFSFTPGNGTGGRIVIANLGSPSAPGNLNGQNYTASSTYGLGSSPGASGFVVYAATGSASTTQTVTVTNLSPGATYYFSVYEYNSTGATSSYGLDYTTSVDIPSSYITIADGNYEVPSTWNCNCVPPANSPVTIDNTVTMTQDESVSDITINSGKRLADGGNTLTISSSSVNNGLHTGAGKFLFASAISSLPISGSGIYQNVESNITNNGNLDLLSNIVINGNLTITTDSVVLGSDTLRLNGAFAGTGKLLGSPTSGLTIGGNSGPIPFSTLNRSYYSLAGFSLISGTTSINTPLDLYGNVTFTGTSSLDFAGQHVTLRSDSNFTATIGNLGTSALLGATNVTAERYIPNDRRAYRTIASSLNTSTTINANWQEGATNPSFGSNIDPKPGYGTQISGTGGAANGFDPTRTNQPSLLTLNAPAKRYVGVPNTTSTNLDSKVGYLMFIRGDRSVDMTSQATPLPSTRTVLEVTGTVPTGNQTYSNLIGNPSGLSDSGWNMLSNPYPSYLNWSALYDDIHNAGGGDISLNYSYIDPNVGTQGGYVAVSTTNVAAPDPGSHANIAIQPGQSFLIQSFTNGAPQAPPIVVIKESHKSSGSFSNPAVFKAQSAMQLFRASIFYYETPSKRRVIDGVATIFDNKYSMAVDQNDCNDLSFFENMAILRNGSKLQIEARPSLAPTDSIMLFIENMNPRAYEMELEGSNLVTAPGTVAFLVDNFTGIKTPLNLSAKTVVPFSVTADAATKAPNRFSVIFGTSTPLPVTITGVRAFNVNDGAQVEWTLSQESNMDRYDVEHSVNAADFNTIGSVKSRGNSTVATVYSYLDVAPAAGTNYYRIKMIDKNGKITYSQIVKLVTGSSSSLISVYPNPVISSNVSIHFENTPKGNYPVIITNNLGQVLFTKEINHPGGSSIQTLNTQGVLTPGVYNLKVGTYTIKLLKQ